MSELTTIKISFYREIRLIISHPTQCLVPWLFLALVVFTLGFALSHSPEVLPKVGPGVIWFGLVMSSILNLPHLFSGEYEDGSLIIWLHSKRWPELIILGKLLAQMFLMGLPAIMLAAVMGFTFNMALYEISVMAFSLFLGVPIIFGLGSLASSLLVSLKHSGLLISIMVLPWYLPSMIFGLMAVENARLGLDVLPPLLLLGAMAWIILLFIPWAIASCLRLSLE